MPDMLGVGVHHPCHHLLVGPQIRGWNVLFWADHIDDLHRVSTGHTLQFGPGQFKRVDPDPTLGASEWNAHDGALPGHQHGQCRNLAKIDVGSKTNPTLCGPHRRQMLNSISEDRLDLGVVVMPKGKTHNHGPLRTAKPSGDVVV